MSAIPGPSDYQPRILGMGHAAIPKVTEFVILGEDQVEALVRILALFKKHNVELLGLESQSTVQTKHFIITAYTGLESADCSLETLLGLLRGLVGVESAKGAGLEGSRYDRFLFPVAALDGSRLIIMATENLIQIEKHFTSLPAETGNLVLFATGRQSGLALIRAFRRSLQKASQSQMLAMAEDELRASGWGLFSFDAAQLEQGSVSVVVRDPIIADVPGATESWLTYGLCAGLIEGIFGMAGFVSGQKPYSPTTRQLKFKLVELSLKQRAEGFRN